MRFTITPQKLIFSAVAVAELEYPADICAFYSLEEQKLIVAPSIPKPYAIPFLQAEDYVKGNGLSVTHAQLVKALRSQMQWGNKGTYRISGMKHPDADRMLIFDLRTAQCGKRKKVDIDPEAFLLSCPPLDKLRESIFTDAPAEALTYVPLLALPEVG